MELGRMKTDLHEIDGRNSQNISRLPYFTIHARILGAGLAEINLLKIRVPISDRTTAAHK
jgi:hypothetical protein